MSFKIKARVLISGCLVFLSSTATVSCKKQSQSSTKSLDNFTRADGEAVKRNSCSGSFEPFIGVKKEWDFVKFDNKSISEVDRNRLLHEVEKSLTSIPAQLQQTVFAMGTSILFTTGLNQKSGNQSEGGSSLSCVNGPADYKFVSEGTGKAEGCWVVDPESGNFVILLNPAVDSINHAFVRTFGYLLSQVLTRVDMDTAGKVKKVENKKFDSFMSKVAVALIADVQLSNGKSSLAKYKSQIDTTSFKHFAFAESFDSFYCSKETLSSMSASFKKTKAEMEFLHEELIQLKLEEADVDSKKGTSLTTNTTTNVQVDEDSSLGFGRLLGGALGGLGRVGGGLLRGAGAVGGGLARGAAGLGRGAVSVGRGVLGGGARLVGGAGRGLGRLFGFGLGVSDVTLDSIMPMYDPNPIPLLPQ